MNEVDKLAIKAANIINEKEVIEFAKEIVSIPSFTGEETALARYLEMFFNERGYYVDMQQVEAGRFQPIARIKGSGEGKDLMFNGHMDVDALTLDCKDPWKPSREGDKLYGWGLWNMKGGLASMIMAAEAVRKAGVELKGDLIVTPVVGELQGGVGTCHMLKHGVTAEMAVVTEPRGGHRININNPGQVIFAINVKGTQNHGTNPSVGSPCKGIDAFQKMLKVINALDKIKLTYTLWPASPELPVVRIGAIRSGRGRDHNWKSPYFNNDFCTVLVDIRTVPGQTADTVIEDVKKMLKNLKEEDKDLMYEIECPPNPKYGIWLTEFPPSDYTIDIPIVQEIGKNYRMFTGKEIEIGEKIAPRFSTDAAHLNRAGIPAVNYGPMGGGYEVGDTQWVSIPEMVLVSKVLASTAIDMCMHVTNC